MTGFIREKDRQKGGPFLYTGTANIKYYTFFVQALDSYRYIWYDVL